mmetsp:Transcript_16224/g.35192  ORF Transcript_16224/g.35192 Transcript_16224/m.35192 type:complete len:209 (+) Transcript_16224:1548-2174(+)
MISSENGTSRFSRSYSPKTAQKGLEKGELVSTSPSMMSRGSICSTSTGSSHGGEGGLSPWSRLPVFPRSCRCTATSPSPAESSGMASAAEWAEAKIPTKARQKPRVMPRKSSTKMSRSSSIMACSMMTSTPTPRETVRNWMKRNGTKMPKIERSSWKPSSSARLRRPVPSVKTAAKRSPKARTKTRSELTSTRKKGSPLEGTSGSKPW